MKALLHKSISVTMALLLSLSTISWKVEKHYCMGRLMNVALFVDVDDCGMNMSLLDEGEQELKNSCCDDEVIIIEGQDDLKISFSDLDIEQQSFLIAFTSSYNTLFSSLKELPVPNEQYPPPILIRDIQLLDDVFLI